jgi:hypothetical protein
MDNAELGNPESVIQEFLPVVGAPLAFAGNVLRFKGGSVDDASQPGGKRAAMGLYISNHFFSGGTISAKFAFEKIGGLQCADIVVFYNPQNTETLNAGIPPEFSFLCVRAYDGKQWNYIAQTGDHATALIPGKVYHLEVALRGSDISMRCNGVEAIRTILQKQYPPSQVGVFFIGESDIAFSEFTVTPRKPRAFVVTQFSLPYNEVYMAVIKSVCEMLKVEVIRADEHQGPGLIIADVVKAIRDSSFVIADISPVNANVFYELGYAHGIRKPAILIAERSTKLPFDVSPFRTLFYDNTIAGKSALEKGLRGAIQSILEKPR